MFRSSPPCEGGDTGEVIKMVHHLLSETVVIAKYLYINCKFLV